MKLIGWLVVFYVPSTAMSFRDGTPFTVPWEGREARFLHHSNLIYPLECLFGFAGHVVLDRKPEPGYNALLLRLTPVYLYSVCP